VTTSNRPVVHDRSPLRLSLARPPAPRELDGGWWPQSRDLAIELADLVAHFPEGRGGILRAAVSPDDWDSAPRRVPVDGASVKVASPHRGERHVIELRTSGRGDLRLLVVPSTLSRDQGEEAMLAAATPGHAYTAASILEVVEESDHPEPFDQWNDGGDAWWDPDPTAPSFRTDD